MSEISVEDFQAGAQEWLAANTAHAPRDYGAICPPDLVSPGIAWQRRIYEAGYAGIHWPTEFGGRGLTIEHNAAWAYECALAGVPAVFNMVGLVLAGGALLKFGTPEQQAKHLHETLRGHHVWCQLFSEPGAGSDLGGLTPPGQRGARVPKRVTGGDTAGKVGPARSREEVVPDVLEHGGPAVPPTALPPLAPGRLDEHPAR